jgi:hypothetical protein
VCSSDLEHWFSVILVGMCPVSRVGGVWLGFVAWKSVQSHCADGAFC